MNTDSVIGPTFGSATGRSIAAGIGANITRSTTTSIGPTFGSATGRSIAAGIGANISSPND